MGGGRHLEYMGGCILFSITALEFYFLGFNIWKISVICLIWKSSFILFNINKIFLLHGLLMLLFSPYPGPCSKLDFIE